MHERSDLPRRLVGFALLGLLLVILVPWFRTGDPFRPWMAGAGFIEDVARNWGFSRVARFAEERRMQLFEGSLDWRIKKGELAVLQVPDSYGLQPGTFFPQLATFARSNDIPLAYLFAQQTSNGHHLRLFVGARGQTSIVGFVEQERRRLRQGMVPGEVAVPLPEAGTAVVIE